MTSDQFYTEVAKLIDQYGSHKVIEAARRSETPRNKYRYVSRNPNTFSKRPSAARPKQYKGCWITQDYRNERKDRIFANIQEILRTMS